MVAIIHNPSNDSEKPKKYNEKKMDGIEGIRPENETSEESEHENGHILVTRNVSDGSTLSEEFERLRLLNKKTTSGRRMEKPSFHMSINPGEDDRPLSEDEAVRLIDEIMKELGYGNQPYRIYKHTDIPRAHYHVVSTRIGQDGKKISDTYEHRRLIHILRGLEIKYGFYLGNSKNEVADEESEAKQWGKKEITPGQSSEHDKEIEKSVYVPSFNIKSKEPLTQQIRNIHSDAMKWSFSSPMQYGMLLRCRYKVSSKCYDGQMYYQGLNIDGQACTGLVDEQSVGLNCLEDIAHRCKEDNENRKEYRHSLEKLLSWCSQNASSFDDFRKLTEKKGVYMVLSWSETGKPYGVTWLDRRTKCAFKGSDTAVGISWLQELADSNGWEVKNDMKNDTHTEIVDINLNQAMTRVNHRKRGVHAKRKQQSTSTSTLPAKGTGIFQGGNSNAPTTDFNPEDDIYVDEAKRVFQIKI